MVHRSINPDECMRTPVLMKQACRSKCGYVLIFLQPNISALRKALSTLVGLSKHTFHTYTYICVLSFNKSSKNSFNPFLHVFQPVNLLMS